MTGETPRTSTVKRTAVKGTLSAGALAVALAYVPQFEGMILRGYKDPIGVVTACAGHTKTAVLGRAYTLEQCNKMLVDDLATHWAGIAKCITVPVATYEQAAYVSFAYNVGTGAFCGSTLARKLNAGDYQGACLEMLRWDKAGGKVWPGLVKRRAVEVKMCQGKLA